MTKDYGNPFDNDPGDEVVRTEEEEFALLAEMQTPAEEFADPAKRARYVEWLKARA